MNKSFVLVTAFLITNVMFGQEKRSSFTFFGGSHYSLVQGISSRSGLGDCPVGETTYRQVKNRGAVLIDAGFLYQYRLFHGKLALIAGINFNQKGYRETGEQMVWQGDTRKSFSETAKFNYFGLMGGLSYRLVQKNKFKAALGLLANPEARANGMYYNTMKPYVLSGRCFMSLEYKVCNRSSVLVMPFFQTALVAYNEPFNMASVYRPSSAGISVGVKF